MTRMHQRTMKIITVAFLLMAFLIPNVLAATIEIDKTAIVSTVIDGSSFTLLSGEKVKLAAIDTPPLGHNGYTESKNYLSRLIQGKTVYLDTGTVTISDQYGRLLCVAYLDYNSTHYENVNMAMIQNGYAVPSVNDTNFNPTTWSWFIPKETPTSSPAAISTTAPTSTPTPTPFSPPTPSVSPDIPEYPAFLSLLIMGITSLIIVALFYGKKRKMTS